MHHINPARVGYIRQKLVAHMELDGYSREPFTGLRVLDMGSGGGLLTEPLARLGARVVGADACEENIHVARAHAERDSLLKDRIEYRYTTAEDMAAGPDARSFDAVCALEIAEHVANPHRFLRACASLVKPGGLLFVSTINRTPQSFAIAIVGAEYITRLVKIGTHEWNKFITPEELRTYLTVCPSAGAAVTPGTDPSVRVKGMAGIWYNPLSRHATIVEGESAMNLSVNYITVAEVTY